MKLLKLIVLTATLAFAGDYGSVTNADSNQNTTNPITKLNLTIDKTTLNKETNTTLKVEATYQDKIYVL